MTTYFIAAMIVEWVPRAPRSGCAAGVAVAIKGAKSVGSILRDGEDLVALGLVVVSLGSLIAVILPFTLESP